MQYTHLGSTGLEVSRLCLGLHVVRHAERRAAVGAGGKRRPSHLPQGVGGRHQFLRHRQRLRQGHQRRDFGQAAEGTRWPPGDGDRHQAVRPDAAGTERPRPVAGRDHDGDRQQSHPARHRLCRPLPDPPLGLDHADRGNEWKRCTTSSRPARPATSALHPCTPGSSPQRWRWPTSTAGPASCRCRTRSASSTGRNSARCCPCAPTKASGCCRGARWAAAC